MQIVLIVAVVATLFIAESAETISVADNVGVRLLMVALCIVSVPLLAAVISKIVLRHIQNGNANPQRLHRWHGRLRRVHTAYWLLATLAVAFSIEWPRIVRFNWHLDRVPLVDDLLILVPVILPLVLSWAVFYRVDRAGMICNANTTSQEDGHLGTSSVTLRKYLDLHVRHYLAIVLMPVIGLLAVHDLVAFISVDLLEGVGALLIMVGAMMLLLGLFPVLLRFVWRTRPLPEGTLRDRLMTMARHGGLELSDILVWETGSMVVNAAVTGFRVDFATFC